MEPRQVLPRQVLVFAALVIAGSGGCRPAVEATPAPIDVSLLSGRPCEPPCWQGLTPGVSTEGDVNEFVRTSELVDQTTLFRGDITRGTGEVVGVGVHWWSRANMAGVPRQFGNSVSIEDGVLRRIMVFLDYEVTLADLLGRYGAPHKSSASWVSLHLPDVDVILYYPNHGFTAWLRLPADDVWLRPESKIRRVRYCRVVPLEEFLELGPEAGYFLADELESLRDWEGYGMVWF